MIGKPSVASMNTSPNRKFGQQACAGFRPGYRGDLPGIQINNAALNFLSPCFFSVRVHFWIETVP